MPRGLRMPWRSPSTWRRIWIDWPVQTRLWHQTWYDSTLPHWLLDRLFSTVSTLATGTCQWWANGRFWAWEGVGCCHGTCSHVWNYEHAMARLFPQLERSVREMQDYNPEAGFDADTGMVRFRGEGWKMWAGDGQAGTVLKAYREHLVSPDAEFLKRLWPRVRKSLEFLIKEDANDDGLLEGSQHNTYDINFFGPNTMVGSLYLAALRAGEVMASEVGDEEFAGDVPQDLRQRQPLERRAAVQRRVLRPEGRSDEASQAPVRRRLPGGSVVRSRLGAPGRVGLRLPGRQGSLGAGGDLEVLLGARHRSAERGRIRPSAGLLGRARRDCSRVRGPSPSTWAPESVLYRDEVWTGIEYQVAGNMVWDGMLTEALAICRAVHERYHPVETQSVERNRVRRPLRSRHGQLRRVPGAVRI